MSVETFEPKSKRDAPSAKAEAPKRGVTIVRNGQYALTMMGKSMNLAMTPKVIEQFRNSGLRGGIQDERGLLARTLGLDDEAVDAIDKIAREHDLTFAEAIRFQLAMSL
ncbi:hypothetical protein [Roseivivax sp. CAU 1761]